MRTRLADQELPADAIDWLDGPTGATIDFSTGWTFTVKLCSAGTKTAALTKTSGITGAATLPNVTIDWSTTDFVGITTGVIYDMYIYARRGVDSKDRVFNPDNPPSFTLAAAPA